MSFWSSSWPTRPAYFRSMFGVLLMYGCSPASGDVREGRRPQQSAFSCHLRGLTLLVGVALASDRRWCSLTGKSREVFLAGGLHDKAIFYIFVFHFHSYPIINNTTQLTWVLQLNFLIPVFSIHYVRVTFEFKHGHGQSMVLGAAHSNLHFCVRVLTQSQPQSYIICLKRSAEAWNTAN